MSCPVVGRMAVGGGGGGPATYDLARTCSSLATSSYKLAATGHAGMSPLLAATSC